MKKNGFNKKWLESFRRYISNYWVVCSLVLLLGIGGMVIGSQFLPLESNTIKEIAKEDREDDNLDVALTSGGVLEENEDPKEIVEQLENDLDKITITDEPVDISDVEGDVQNADDNKAVTKDQVGGMSLEKLPDTKSVVRGDDELVIGFITDTHVASELNSQGTRKLGDNFVKDINYFVEKMNNEVVPDLMIVNGDVIEGTNVSSAIGTKELQLTKEIFSRSKIPTYWVLGNHDLRSVDKQQWKKALGIDYTRKAFDIRGYRVIILDSNYTKSGEDVKPGQGYTRGKVGEGEIKWLKSELKNTKKRPIVFMHHPPLRDIKLKKNNGLLDDAEELRKIFAEHKVIAVFAGHIEDFYYENSKGVNYFVLPGIHKHPKYKGTFSVVNVVGKKVSVDANYLVGKDIYRTFHLGAKIK